MMLLVGTRDLNVENGTLLNEKCPNCKSENTLHFSIYKKYTYITLVPLFPVGKYVNIECRECREVFDYDDLHENAQETLKNIKLGSSIWMFTGSIILALFLIYSINNFLNNKDKTSVFIKNPIEGDVYNLKLSNGYYSTMRIDRVTKDAIQSTQNDYNAYLPYEVDDIDKTQNYSDRKINYSRKELNKLYEDGKIIKITRKNLNLNNQVLVP